METYPRSELTEQISDIRDSQNGDTIKQKDFLAERRMVNYHKFQGHFHIQINPQSRKYLCFDVQGQSYQFKALPFSLSTAAMDSQW